MKTNQPLRRLRYSGRVSPDDYLHMTDKELDALGFTQAQLAAVRVAPNYVHVPGVGYIPQYANTVVGQSSPYNPPADCNGNFMSSKFQPNNNCYAYACDISTNTFPQPGRAHGQLLPPNFTAANVERFAILDGLIPVDAPVARANGHYVALFISDPDPVNGWDGDYHWVRCDDAVTFQSWSQKAGGDQITNFDFAGNPITDPAHANWNANMGPQAGGDDLIISYNFYSYMFVPDAGVDII